MTVTNALQHLGGHGDQGDLLDQHVPGERRLLDGERAPISSRSAPTSPIGNTRVNRTRVRAATGRSAARSPAPGLADFLHRARDDARARRPGASFRSIRSTSASTAQDTWRATSARHASTAAFAGSRKLRPAGGERRAVDLQHGQPAEGREEHRRTRMRLPDSSGRATRGSRREDRASIAQWLNLSPRIGLAWDVSGDGRLGGPHVMRHLVRLPERRLPQHQRVGAALRQPVAAAGSSGTVRRSVQDVRRRSASDRHQRGHAIRQLTARTASSIRTSTRRARSRGTRRSRAARHRSGACRPAISAATRIASGDRWR